ncbi:MAG: Gldg family protein [Lentisphaeria bacterium]|nr:Gldg family protein [Lentisphaeria bacterium]
MKPVLSIAKRELRGYFCTPIAYVFLIAFLAMSTIATFLVGDFFTFNEASLRTLFFWLPWLYLLFVPAAGMRLWAEERRQGTVEILMTMPVTPFQAVLGKFLAGWIFLGIGLLLTFPLPITVAWLGSPDIGAMLTGYLGGFLLSGAFLSLCSLASACTKNQVISFVFSVAICLLLVLGGHGPTSLFLSKWGLNPETASFVAKFSVIPHLENFQRGVLDLQDILYFLSIAVIALRLNQAAIEMQRGRIVDEAWGAFVKRLSHPVIQSLLICVSVLSLNSICSHFNLTLDCTADRLFTLSESTRQVLDELDRPVTIDFYRTPELPGLPAAFKSHIRRIDDLLTEYQRRSKNMVIVNRIVPEADSPQEEAAVEAGILPQQISPTNIESRLYIGVGLSQTARKSIVIPYLEPTRATFLEYDLTRGLAKLTPRKRASIAIISPMKILGGVDVANQRATQPWALVEELKNNNFDLMPLPWNCERIPDETDVLLLAQPEQLPENTLKAIDAFIQSGRPLAAFLDPVCWTQMNNRHGNLKYAPCESSSIKPLTDAWGIQFTDDKVLVDTELATILLNSKGATVRHLDWLTITPAQFTGDRITTALSTLEFFKAGVFSMTPIQGLTVTPLINSSQQAQPLLSSLTFRSAQDVMADFKPQNKTFPLAVRLEGVLPSPYGQTQNPPKKSTVILVGDADWLHDAMSVQRGNHNIQFLLNILDNLVGGDSLSNIRNRANIQRPLTKLQDMEAAGERQYQERLEAFEKEYREARSRLMNMEKARQQSGSTLLSAAQREEFVKLKRQIAESNRQLRNLRSFFRKNIETLQFRIILANLLIVPTLLALAGCVFAWKRR